MKFIQLGGHRYKDKPIRGYAMVDDEDFEKVNVFEWHLNDKGYAVRRPKKTIRMHRFILNIGREDRQVDHIDGNKLNNQKGNLRLCSLKQNMHNRGKYSRNTSGYKGVWWHKQLNKWCATIRFNSKSIHLGVFNDREKAALAYNRAAIKYFGDFCRLNQI